jgi:glycosyltransferase involved in cell wall biosynthesis
MRIAQVAPLYESVPPKLYGGTERVVSNLTEELVTQGHEVTLFASGDSVTSARLVPQCPNGLRLTENSVDPLAPHMAMLEEVFSCKHQFDIIHFHCDYLHFPWTRRERVPTVTTLHGRLDIPELPAIYRAFAEMPVVSISDSQQLPLPWLNWQGTVYHGIASRWYRPERKTGDYLAFLGRVSPEKGPVEAIEIARRAGMKLKFAAKVDRADQAYYEAVVRPLLQQPHVDYVGEIGAHEASEFLGGAAALLFPINWPEPFGLVMIEAMACGTPVIAFPHGSVPEVIDDGITGFLARDVNSAVKAIDRLPGIDRRQCYETFLKRFSAKRMAEDYSEIYSRIVGEEPESLAFATGASIG